MKRYKKIVLNNGIRLILAPMPDSHSVTFMIIVGVGSRYESKNLSGISHFIEHTIFKGSKKRPTSLAISEAIDQIGGVFSADTSYEFTYYWAKVGKGHFSTALEVVSDAFLNAQFKKEDIEKERGVIFEEINSIKDEPIQEGVFNLLELIWPNYSLGREIAGSKEAVEKIGRKEIINFKKKYYCGENIVISIAGGFDEKKAVRDVQYYFKNLQRGKKADFKPFLGKQEAPRLKIKRKSTKQTHLALGIRSLPRNDPDRFTLQILETIFGSGSSSRLFQGLREKMGVAYYLFSSLHAFQDTGCFTICFGVDKKRVGESLKAVLNILEDLKSKRVSRRELKKAKEYLRGHLFLSLETSDELAQWYGLQEMLMPKILEPEEIVEQILTVKASEVKRVASLLFKDKNFSLSIVGPFEEKGNLEKIFHSKILR